MAKCNIKRGKSREKTTKREQKMAATKAESRRRTERTENNNNESKAAAKQSCKDKSARILEILFIYISLVPQFFPCSCSSFFPLPAPSAACSAFILCCSFSLLCLFVCLLARSPTAKSNRS